MTNHLINALNNARKESMADYERTGYNNFWARVHALEQQYSSDRRYKLHVLACSMNGAGVSNSLTARYMGRKYYFTFNHSTNEYEEA